MRKKVWGAIAVAVAAVAVFASTQQSLALWSDSASANGGTATAASVNLTVGTSAGTSAAYTLANLTTAATPVVPETRCKHRSPSRIRGLILCNGECSRRPHLRDSR